MSATDPDHGESSDDGEGAGVREHATFTKDMSILDALQADPRAREIFSVHGMGCIGCMGATMESIENGAKMHGIDPQAILDDLNKLKDLPEPTEA